MVPRSAVSIRDKAKVNGVELVLQTLQRLQQEVPLCPTRREAQRMIPPQWHHLRETRGTAKRCVIAASAGPIALTADLCGTRTDGDSDKAPRLGDQLQRH